VDRDETSDRARAVGRDEAAKPRPEALRHLAEEGARVHRRAEVAHVLCKAAVEAVEQVGGVPARERQAFLLRLAHLIAHLRAEGLPERLLVGRQREHEVDPTRGTGRGRARQPVLRRSLPQLECRRARAARQLEGAAEQRRPGLGRTAQDPGHVVERDRHQLPTAAERAELRQRQHAEQ
jgi:hypothetical protein